MSPLLDLQQRAQEIGRIRIGATVKSANGRTRPAKLDAFRFTTNNPHAAKVVAEMYGGEVKRWVGGSQEFEVYTTATYLDVMVPPGEMALSQHYEMWSGGGCQRRCDSVTNQLTGGPCLCPADIADRMAAAAKGDACKPTTRVSVILPDLPGLGVWRHESHGYNAAHELGGTAAFLARARDAGEIIPATMRLEQRESKTGTETHKFAVVVLDVRASLREIINASGSRTLAESLPPAPSGAKAIAAPEPSRSADLVALLAEVAAATGTEDLRSLYRAGSVLSEAEKPVLHAEIDRRRLALNPEEIVDAEVVDEDDPWSTPDPPAGSVGVGEASTAPAGTSRTRKARTDG